MHADPNWDVGAEAWPELNAVEQTVRVQRATLSPGWGAEIPEGRPKTMERDQVSDMIAASEARTEARFERMLAEVKVGFADLRGEMEIREAKIATLPTTWVLLGTVFAGALTVVALLIAALALGNDMFSRGFDAHVVAREAAAEAIRSAPAQVTPEQPLAGKQSAEAGN